MADFSRQDDDFLKNIPPELVILHHTRDIIHGTIFAVCCQRESHENYILASSSAIKHRIELALTEFRKILMPSLCYLVQFWAPVSIKGRSFMITSELPFSINDFVDPRPVSYRKDCMGYRYSADWEDDDTGFFHGPPARVFHTGIAESNYTTDYSMNDHYPFTDCAVTCQGFNILFVPVYEPQGGCVAVLECICFGNHGVVIEDYFHEMSAVFQSANLRFKEGPWVSYAKDSFALAELQKALKHVCTRKYIPFAQVWRPKINWPNNTGYFVIEQKWHKRNYSSCCSFYTKCKKNHLEERQGVVGQAFSSLTSCFCGDLTQLSPDVYPLAIDASSVGLVSSFAVCLRHSSTGCQTFALEFFFSGSKRTCSNSLKVVRSVLKTLKHKFPNLRQASGHELGADIRILSSFPVDVIDVDRHDPATDDAYPPAETTLAKVPNETEFPHNRGEVSDALRTIIDHLLYEKFVVSPHDPSQAEMMQSDQPSLENDHNIDTLQKDSDEIAPTVNDIDMDVRITREILEQHAVAKLELVAKHLQVSRSTFKRICRKHGIKNWRSFNKAMAKQMNPDSLKAAGEHVKHRFCSRIGDQGFSLIKDTISSGETVQSMPEQPRTQNSSTVTVKASYEGDMIRLEFPTMSKIEDLVEKVAKRFNLQPNSFKIKYEDEDGDWILLATDEDLSKCFSNVESYRKNIIYVKIDTVCNIHS